MLYLFDKNEELIRVITKECIESAVQKEKLNNLMTLEADLSTVEFDVLKQAEYVGHFDYKNKEKFYMYKIMNNKLDDASSIKAVHIAFDELKVNGYIRDKRPNNATIQEALSIILEGTRWEIGNVYSENTGSANWYDKTKLDALSEFLTNWNVEMDLRIKFDGQKIYARYIDVYNTRGGDTGKRLVYGSNTVDIVAEEVKSNIYTALIGRGKGEEKFDENGQSTGGYGRKINFKDVEWSKANGDPVDKPLGQEYVENKEATALYGFSNGQPRIRITDFGECTDPKELLKLTYAELMNVSRPQLELSTEVERIGTVNLGDSVYIIRKDINLYYSARIFEIERDLLDDNLTKVKLGDYIETSDERRNKAYKDRLDAINNALKEFQDKSYQTNNDFKKLLQEGLEQTYYNEDGYNYEFKVGNKYNLPAGFYSFDKPIDESPSKVIYIGAGKIAIANSKKPDGKWNWSTFGTGDGFVADMLVAGVLRGGKVRWNLETGEFIIGTNADDYLLKFDGSTLSFGKSSLKPENMSEELKAELKGEPGAQGPQGEQGTNATLPQWWQDWNKTTTTINGDYILTPRMYIGQQTKGVFFGDDVVRHNGVSYSGLVGYWEPDVTFHLDTDGSLTLGNTPGRQFIVDVSGNVTCPTITSEEIAADAITTDILIPGYNHRIIMEDNCSPGDDNCLSVDTNSGDMRLKYNRDNYVRVGGDNEIRFYIGGSAAGKVKTDGFYVQDTHITSDSRAKENIRFLDHTQVLRSNDTVDTTSLNTSDIYNFVKNELNFATYNMKNGDKVKISPITQQIKNPEFNKILVGTDTEGNQYIEQYSYISVLGVALKEALNKIDKLELEIENLKKGGV